MLIGRSSTIAFFYSSGIQPSLRLLSSSLISSALEAFAIAALIRALSSGVISLPALPAVVKEEPARGSSSVAATAALAAFVVTVVASCVARAVSSKSGVRNRLLAACRSCARELLVHFLLITERMR